MNCSVKQPELIKRNTATLKNEMIFVARVSMVYPPRVRVEGVQAWGFRVDGLGFGFRLDDSGV